MNRGGNMDSIRKGMFLIIDRPKSQSEYSMGSENQKLLIDQKKKESVVDHCPVLFSFFFGEDYDLKSTEAQIK